MTLEVTLAGDTVKPSGGDEDFGRGATAALLSGISSLQESTTGFNAVIKPTLGAANVERDDGSGRELLSLLPLDASVVGHGGSHSALWHCVLRHP